MFAYFVGIALVGAGLGALVAHVGVELRAARGDPPAVVGHRRSRARRRSARWCCSATSSSSRTAFGGAWTMIVGGLALAGDRGAARAAAAGDVWILYPADARRRGSGWVPIAWIVLGLIGHGRAAGRHWPQETLRRIDGDI